MTVQVFSFTDAVSRSLAVISAIRQRLFSEADIAARAPIGLLDGSGFMDGTYILDGMRWPDVALTDAIKRRDVSTGAAPRAPAGICDGSGYADGTYFCDGMRWADVAFKDAI